MQLITIPLTWALLCKAAQAILVPSPPGPYSVAVKDFELIDTSRTNILAPESNSTRRFMASAYLPVDTSYNCMDTKGPYMPPLTASVFDQLGASLGIPDGFVEQFEMKFCDLSTIRCNATISEEYPVIVFSPGFAGTRLVYGAMARSLASLGYIVFTVDHTYETQVVEFPDGSAVYGVVSGTSNITEIEKLIDIRADDVDFLTSQLSNKTLTQTVFAGFPGIFNPYRVTVYGHSLGGSTSARVAWRNPLVTGGINLDGSIYGAVFKQGIKGKPFINVATTRNGNDTLLPEWMDFYDRVDGPKMELTVKNTQHYAFTDILLLLAVSSIPAASQPRVDEIFGTIDGRAVEMAQNAIVSGLLELLFDYDARPLNNLGMNPDIDVVLSDLPTCR